MSERELELIEKGTPCYVNYFDKSLLTSQQVLERGYEECCNLEKCEDTKIPCALRAGLYVAQKIRQGSNLKKEINILSNKEGKWINEEWFYSFEGNTKKVELIKGRSNVLRAIEYFANIVLLNNPNKSILSKCQKCNGVRLEDIVFDSVWFRDGPRPCAGTGETKSRRVEYCPNCEKKPVGGVVYQEDLDKEEADFLDRLSKCPF